MNATKVTSIDKALDILINTSPLYPTSVVFNIYVPCKYSYKSIPLTISSTTLKQYINNLPPQSKKYSLYRQAVDAFLNIIQDAINDAEQNC